MTTRTQGIIAAIVVAIYLLVAGYTYTHAMNHYTPPPIGAEDYNRRVADAKFGYRAASFIWPLYWPVHIGSSLAQPGRSVLP